MNEFVAIKVSVVTLQTIWRYSKNIDCDRLYYISKSRQIAPKRNLARKHFASLDKKSIEFKIPGQTNVR